MTKTLPEKLGNTPIKRLVGLYGIFWKEKRGFDFKILSWGKFGKILKTLLDNYTELQVACFIGLHFNWMGITDTDPREGEFLAKASYAIELMISKAPAYETYLRNTYGLDFDNEEEVSKYLFLWLEKLSTYTSLVE